MVEIEGLARSLEGIENAFFDPPNTTLNVGELSGGRAKNIVPGECRFLVEWRPLPNDNPKKIPKAHREATAMTKELYPLRYASVTVQRLEKGFETSDRSPLVKTLEELSGRRSGSIAFNTEAAQWQKMGSDVVVFGPGDMRVAHCTGEYVPRSELMKAIDILNKVVGRLCSCNPSAQAS